MAIVEKPSPYVLGIDLGTSNSSIAVFRQGEATIIPVDGEKTLPSVVNVRNTGEILVGKQAKNRMLIAPESTVSSVKRELGTDWQKEFKGLPDRIYKPQDIAAEILSKLVIGARETGTPDLHGTPKNVVICIPANFNDVQKAATREAAELANLNVLFLLEEPVAAAIAYAMDKERDQTILVYDLGGGTFDVSILKVDTAKSGSPSMKVLAKEGVARLGGDDFDLEIMKLAAASLKESSGLDILDTKKEQGVSIKALREAQQKLKQSSEASKWELLESSVTEIIIPNLIKDESGNMHNLDFEISRDVFEDAIRPLILQSREAVEKALVAARLEIEDISRIILVGGSTKVPLVRAMLKEMFQRDPYGDTDPDTVVARGAAIYGAMLTTPESEGLDEDDLVIPIDLSNIITHHLGIETTGNHFNCLIEKDQEIPDEEPLVVTKNYTTPRDNMTELRIAVYQADRSVEYTSDEGSVCIGEFFLVGIPPKPRGQEQIEVTFAIDQQNVLKVTARSSGSTGELDIQRH